MKLSKLILKNPEIIKKHMIKILMINPYEFATRLSSYLSSEIYCHLQRERLPTQLEDMLINIPQFMPLLAHNDYLKPQSYVELIDSDNIYTLISLSFANTSTWEMIGFENIRKLISKYINLGWDKTEKDWHDPHNDDTLLKHTSTWREFVEKIQNIKDTRVLWYVFRNMQLDGFLYYSLSANKHTPIPILFNILQLKDNPDEKNGPRYGEERQNALLNLYHRFGTDVHNTLFGHFEEFVYGNIKPSDLNVAEYIAQHKELDDMLIRG